MSKLCDKHCLRCIYFGKSTLSCDFLWITGKLRGCDPGKDCTRRVVGIKKRKEITTKQAPPQKEYKPLARITPEEDHKRRILYDQGLSDHAIAAACGCASNTICRWRKVRGLKPNCPSGFQNNRKDENNG